MNRRLRGAVLCSLALLTIAWPKSALAYHQSDSFARSANSGGGGGFYFTGSQRWRRYDCSICHVDTDPSVPLIVTWQSQPTELSAEHVYQPEQTYTITVTMANESRGLSAFGNTNLFYAEFSRDDHQPQGVFSGDILVVEPLDQNRVVAAAPTERVTEWTFAYTAPPAGNRRLTLHLSAVDGDGADNSGSAAFDSLGDNVFVGSWRICEAGMPCDLTPPTLGGDDPNNSPASCAVATRHAGRPGSVPTLLVIVVLAILRSTVRSAPRHTRR